MEELLVQRSYRMYSGTRIDMRTDARPALESLICLSCHDGSGMDVAFDGPLQERLDIGTDLQNDHPISIQYDPSLDRAFHPVTTGAARRETVNGLPLYNGRVECSTCHDPHGPTAGRLRLSNQGSALCLACHIK
jgi:predicted CXXCH cytochrome family protein